MHHVHNVSIWENRVKTFCILERLPENNSTWATNNRENQLLRSFTQSNHGYSPVKCRIRTNCRWLMQDCAWNYSYIIEETLLNTNAYSWENEKFKNILSKTTLTIGIKCYYKTLSARWRYQVGNSSKFLICLLSIDIKWGTF